MFNNYYVKIIHKYKNKGSSKIILTIINNNQERENCFAKNNNREDRHIPVLTVTNLPNEVIYYCSRTKHKERELKKI